MSEEKLRNACKTEKLRNMLNDYLLLPAYLLLS